MFVSNILLIVYKRAVDCIQISGRFTLVNRSIKVKWAVDCIWFVWRKRWRHLPSPAITDE